MKIYFLLSIIFHLTNEAILTITPSCLNYGKDLIINSYYPLENISRIYPVNTYLSFSLLTLPSLIDSKIESKETIHLDNTYTTHRYTTDLQLDNIFIKQLTIYTLEDDFRSYQDYRSGLSL